MPRAPILIAGLIVEYLAVIGLLAALMPGPRTAADYLVIGTLATFVTLATVFGMMILGRKKRDEKPAAEESGSAGEQEL